MRHTFITTSSGVKLSVRYSDGKKVPIILIHGLASNSMLYALCGQLLEKDGYKVVMLDLRGHGLSDKPKVGYDFKTISLDIYDLISQLNLNDYILVGQSWGANVVLDYLSRYENRVKGGILIDGGWINLRAHFTTFEQAAKVLAPPKFADVKYESLTSTIKSMHKDWPELSIKGTMENFDINSDGSVRAKLSYENHMKILKELYSDDPIGKASKIKVPVLLIVAGQKTSEKLTDVNNLTASLKVSKTEWFENADHDIHAQHPTLVKDLIEAEIRNGIFS
jgi:pimeloyl-ACP methyl ester carboxylesterase